MGEQLGRDELPGPDPYGKGALPPQVLTAVILIIKKQLYMFITKITFVEGLEMSW